MFGVLLFSSFEDDMDLLRLRLASIFFEELSEGSVGDVVVVEVLIALLSANGLKAELFELNLSQICNETYPLSK